MAIGANNRKSIGWLHYDYRTPSTHSRSIMVFFSNSHRSRNSSRVGQLKCRAMFWRLKTLCKNNRALNIYFSVSMYTRELLYCNMGTENFILYIRVLLYCVLDNSFDGIDFQAGKRKAGDSLSADRRISEDSTDTLERQQFLEEIQDHNDDKNQKLAERVRPTFLYTREYRSNLNFETK